jgi:hypothetical protein
MTTLKFARRAASVALAALALFAAGCGGGMGTVKGKITVRGQPLAGGLITFLPQGENNNPVSVAINMDGTYDSGPIIPSGLAKVYIIPSSPVGRGPAAGGGDVIPVAKKALAASAGATSVPVKYQTVETSGLTVTVKPGETVTFDQDLTP